MQPFPFFYDYNKELIIMAVPSQTDSNNKTPITAVENPFTYLVDIQRCKQVITITGFLMEESGDTALAKKDDIEVMLSTTPNITLTWKVGTTTITKKGSIIKCKITELPQRTGDGHPTTQGAVPDKKGTHPIKYPTSPSLVIFNPVPSRNPVLFVNLILSSAINLGRLE